MTFNHERYRVFEIRAPDEEEFFDVHGYSFRPRLLREWIPSWHTTGISPLRSEDAEITKVIWSPYRQIIRTDNPVDSPR